MDPTSTITRRDLSLTYAEFSMRIQRSKYVGLKVLTPIGVPQESTTFQRFNVKDITQGVEDTRRNADGTYNRDEGRFSSDSYQTIEHGVEEVVDHAKVERWGDLIRIETNARERAIDRMLTRLEYDIAQAVFNTSTWTGATLTTAVAGTKYWNHATQTTVDPIADIDNGSAKVKATCGVRGNVAVMSHTAYLALLRTDRIETLLRSDGVSILIQALSGIAPDNAAISQVNAGLMSILQLDEIIVADAAYNSADKGLTASFSDFWSTTMCMVCRIENDGWEGDLSLARPHIGRTLFCTKDGEPLPGDMMAGEDSLIFDEYEEPRARGSILRPRNKRGIKIIHPEAGHLITAVTA